MADNSHHIFFTVGEKTLKTEILSHYNIFESDIPKVDLQRYYDAILFDKIDGNSTSDNIAIQNSEAANYFENIDDDTLYPKVSNDVTIDSKVTSKCIINVPYDIDFNLNRLRKIRESWDVQSYKKITSELYSTYLKKIIEDDNQKPYLSDNDILNNNFQISNVSARVFIVSKTLDYEVVNCSPYLIDCNWNDAESGGNFSFTLANLAAERQNGRWRKANHNTIADFENEDKYWSQDSVNGYRTLNVDFDNIIAFKDYYFDMVLQKYDIVFIRGERLFAEDKEKDIDKQEIISIGDLASKNWDMIGLIDRTLRNYQLSNGSVGFNVQGRDLYAVLIEDSTVVIPQIIGDDNNKETIEQFKLNYIANDNEAKKAHSYQRLVGYIPEMAFYIKQPVSRLVDWFYDKLSSLTLVNKEKLFSEFKKDNPYLSYNENNWIPLKFKGEYERFGIWNLIAVWVDESVKNRRVFDASLAMMQGSMINFIHKIVNPPLAEFYTLTMGSYFHWIVRKPPIDGDSYIRLYELCKHDLYAEQIQNMSLEWDNSDIYSIFRFIPANPFGGADATKNLYPCICLPELMDLYGIKYLEITSSYLDASDFDIGFKQALEDLKYLIETQVYKQFSQKGQITITGNRTIKKGQAIYLVPLDLLCYVKSVSNQYSISDEQVNRTTILEVERCIVKKHYELYFNLVDFSDQTVHSNPMQRNWYLKKNTFNYFLGRNEFDR